MVPSDDVLAPFFFNENRASICWYGMSGATKQLEEVTHSLLIRLSLRHSRVWLAVDDSMGDLPDSTRRWMETSWCRLGQNDFANGVRLLLHATEARP